MAVTHFVTQFTHVCRHFEAYCRKQKQNLRENCFENVVSEIYQENLFCPQNPPKILNVFMVFQFYFILFLHFFLKVVLWTHRPFFLKSETTFSKQFSLNNFFCFLLYTPKCLETCVNCVTKCVTAKIYPMKVLIFQIIFF